MKKLILCLITLLFALSVQSQTVIKRCAGGVTVGGNSPCPTQSQGGTGATYGRSYLGIAYYNGGIAVDPTTLRRWTVSDSGYSKGGVKKQLKAECGNNCEYVMIDRNQCAAAAYDPSTNKVFLDSVRIITAPRKRDGARPEYRQKAENKVIEKCEKSTKNRCEIMVEGFCGKEE